VNWINSIPPKIRSFLTTKREVPDNLWVKCPESGQMVFYKDLEANLFVVPGSNCHMRMAAEGRLKRGLLLSRIVDLEQLDVDESEVTVAIEATSAAQ